MVFKRRSSISMKDDSNKMSPENDKAPDGGWGWACVFGSVLMHMIVGGISRCSGLMFLVMQERFDSRASSTAWIFSVGDTMVLTLMVLFGTVVYSVSFILSSLVPFFEFQYFSFGVLSGFGRCFIFTPSILIIGLYFDKKRSLATGFSSAGTGIGGLFMPLLFDWLFREYGFSGTMMMLAGISLQVCISASLYRPLVINMMIAKLSRKNTSRSLIADENGEFETLVSLSPTKGISELKNTESIRKGSAEVLSNADPNNCVSNDNIGPTVAPKSDHVAMIGCNTNKLVGVSKENVLPTTTILKRKRLFEFGLLRNKIFLLFCLSTFVYTVAVKASLTFFPALAKENGISDTEAALLLSTMAGADFFGRLGGGILDHKAIRPYRLYVYNIVIALMAVITPLLTLAKSFAVFAVIIAFNGLLFGLFVSQLPVMLVDILGVEKLHTSLGILNMFSGIAMLIGTPISGLFRDNLGSFKESYYFNGSLLCVSVILMLLGNLINKCRNKENYHLTATKDITS